MKTKFLLIAIIATMSQTAYSQLNLLWNKSIPSEEIKTVTFSHNSQWIMAWPAQQDSMVYDSYTGNLVKARIPSYVQYPLFSLVDDHVYGITGNRIASSNLATGIEEQPFEPSDSAIVTNWNGLPKMVMSNDGRYILAWTVDHKILVWDTKTGKIIKSRKLYQDNYDHMSIDSTDFVAEIQQIAINCDNSKIMVKEFSQFRKLLYITWDKGQPKGVYDTKMLLKLNVYDFNTMDSIGCLFKEPVYAYFGSFVLSHDCQKIAFWYQNNTYGVVIYDFNTMQEISKLNFPGVYGTYIKFSPDDKSFVTASSEAGLMIWDLLSGKKLIERSGGYYSLDISNDNDGIFIGSGGGGILGVIAFPVLGIKEPLNDSKGDILYPNPSTGILSVSLSLPVSSLLTVDLTDLNGRLIANVYQQLTEQGNGDIHIDLSGYQDGTYLLRLRAKNYEKVYKVIITK